MCDQIPIQPDCAFNLLRVRASKNDCTRLLLARRILPIQASVSEWVTSTPACGVNPFVFGATVFHLAFALWVPIFESKPRWSIGQYAKAARPSIPPWRQGRKLSNHSSGAAIAQIASTGHLDRAKVAQILML
jgi:hypothetical protein